MALEKEDLKQIKEIVEKSVGDLTNDVARGFESVQRRFEAIDKRFEGVDKRFDLVNKRFDTNDAAHRNINARLDTIETDLSNLRSLHKEVREIRVLLDEMLTRREFEKLDQRLARVERHLGFAK